MVSNIYTIKIISLATIASCHLLCARPLKANNRMKETPQTVASIVNNRLLSEKVTGGCNLAKWLGFQSEIHCSQFLSNFVHQLNLFFIISSLSPPVRILDLWSLFELFVSSALKDLQGSSKTCSIKEFLGLPLGRQ